MKTKTDLTRFDKKWVERSKRLLKSMRQEDAGGLSRSEAAEILVQFGYTRKYVNHLIGSL